MLKRHAADDDNEHAADDLHHPLGRREDAAARHHEDVRAPRALFLFVVTGDDYIIVLQSLSMSLFCCRRFPFVVET